MSSDNRLTYSLKRVARVSKTFARSSKECKQAILIADTIDDARLYRIGYCQDGQELRADYMEYVYDNSFARRRRRNRY